MKHFLIVFLFVVFWTMNTVSASPFVSINNQKEFVLNDKRFYPMVVNYGVQIRRTSAGDYWVSPTHCYGNSNEFECNNKQSCLDELKAQFSAIKQMGFNTIRLVGMEVKANINSATVTNNKVYMRSTLLDINTPVYYSKDFEDELTSTGRQKLFALITDVLNIAEDRGLKVIFLTGGPDDSNRRAAYADYLEALATNFKDNKSLLAYDLFNEPSWYSKMVSEFFPLKSTMNNIVCDWITRMKTQDTNHLITIGFTGSNTVGTWDPEILPVDFASFHSYGSIESLSNEIYWYSKNMTKPWIIGETGLAADNIKITYEAQRQYGKAVSEYCRDCGGAGFSWWQYQDVWWGNYNEDYLGLLSHSGSYLLDNGLSIQGTPKPVVDEFKLFDPLAKNSSKCVAPTNFNSQQGIKKVSGRVLDNNGQPLSGVNVVARNKDYAVIGSCFSKQDGSYEIFATDKVLLLYFEYLGYENVVVDVSQESPIDNSNPLFIQNTTIGIGLEQNYKSNNSAYTDNLIINGNGQTGGKATVEAPLSVQLRTGTKVEKGGILTIRNTEKKVGDSRLTNKIGACGQALKSVEEEVATKDLTSRIITLYPNPAYSTIIINNAVNASISVTNMEGDLVKTITHYNGETIDVSGYPNGVYAVSISSELVNETLKFTKVQ